MSGDIPIESGKRVSDRVSRNTRIDEPDLPIGVSCPEKVFEVLRVQRLMSDRVTEEYNGGP